MTRRVKGTWNSNVIYNGYQRSRRSKKQKTAGLGDKKVQRQLQTVQSGRRQTCKSPDIFESVPHPGWGGGSQGEWNNYQRETRKGSHYENQKKRTKLLTFRGLSKAECVDRGHYRSELHAQKKLEQHQRRQGYQPVIGKKSTLRVKVLSLGAVLRRGRKEQKKSKT